MSPPRTQATHDFADLHNMLYALEGANHSSDVVTLPSRLDEIDSVLALRTELDEAIAGAYPEIYLHCHTCEFAAGPVLGWLIWLGKQLNSDARRIVCVGMRAELKLALRQLDPNGQYLTIRD